MKWVKTTSLDIALAEIQNRNAEQERVEWANVNSIVDNKHCKDTRHLDATEMAGS